jgi:hypothetical protein
VKLFAGYSSEVGAQSIGVTKAAAFVSRHIQHALIVQPGRVVVGDLSDDGGNRCRLSPRWSGRLGRVAVAFARSPKNRAL